ncbi:hypothetical protein MJO29_009373, partial [Puccinia striiformis f. sp. tritici]
VIGQYTIASEIRMSGPVSKHPPPRINPSTEMSRLSLTSSSLRKPKLDGNLCREAGTGLARPEVNSCSPQSTCTPTRQIISTDSAPPRQGGCLASYRRLPCVVQLAIPIILSLVICDIRRTSNIEGAKDLGPKEINVLSDSSSKMHSIYVYNHTRLTS